ncbi:MAG: pyridoxal-phosphate dependent enzyme, partial [Bacteroidales bacterium]|nr:pyridoxal-phosphate dependent enzyme [Bacteroidales bacterium]
MNNSFPSKQDVLDARQRLLPFVHRTPVLTCDQIDQITGNKLFFKCENFQKAGAFKSRGALNATLQLSAEQRLNGVATHSSGNH